MTTQLISSLTLTGVDFANGSDGPAMHFARISPNAPLVEAVFQSWGQWSDVMVELRDLAAANTVSDLAWVSDLVQLDFAQADVIVVTDVLSYPDESPPSVRVTRNALVTVINQWLEATTH